MQPHPIFCKSLRELPQSVCFVWFSHLTILEWRQWSHLKFNQSTEISILGFSPFPLNTSIILHNKKIYHLSLVFSQCTSLFNLISNLHYFALCALIHTTFQMNMAKEISCKLKWTWIHSLSFLFFYLKYYRI